MHKVAGRLPYEISPYIRNDNEQALNDHIRRIAANIAAGAVTPEAVGEIRNNFAGFADEAWHSFQFMGNRNNDIG